MRFFQSPSLSSISRSLTLSILSASLFIATPVRAQDYLTCKVSIDVAYVRINGMLNSPSGGGGHQRIAAVKRYLRKAQNALADKDFEACTAALKKAKHARRYGY